MSHQGASVGVAIAGGVIVYGAILAGIVALAFRWSRRIMERKSSGVRSEIERLGGRAAGEGQKGGLYTGTETRYEVGGDRIYVNSYYVSRDFVRVNLRAEAPPLPWVVMYPEGAVERFGKAIGLNREVQLGDQAFDDAIYIDTVESDDRIQKLLAGAEIRQAILDIISLGYKVQCSTRGVEAFQVVYAMNSPDTSRVAEVVPRLARLARIAPSFAGEALLAPRKLGVLSIVLIVFALLSAALSGALVASGVFSRTLNAAHALLAVLVAGGALWFLYMMAVVLSARGRPNALRMVLVTALIALFTVPLGGGALALLLDQRLDSGAVEEHVTTIRKLYRKDRIVRVASWRTGREAENTYADWSVFRTLKSGDRVIVRVHPGAFGLPWTEVVKAPPAGG